MTIEAVFGIIAVLAIFATVMFFALRQRDREHQELMAALKAGDQRTVLGGILSGVVVLAGFVALIGYEDGAEGVISLFAVVAVMIGVGFLAWFAIRRRQRHKKRHEPSAGPSEGSHNRLLIAGFFSSVAAIVGGTATLVAIHGATTIVIYYIVVPLMAGLILFVKWSYRRLRRESPNN